MSLSINPESTIGFTLKRTDKSTAPPTKSILTLTNNSQHEFYAFKVKTTQPRRYLVRPNQGLIKHGQSEEVTIILVDKEKQILLNEFEQIGPGAIESSKDKFLIQSKVVEEEFYESTKSNATAKEFADVLTTMWREAATDKAAISNKKLQVKHTVDTASLSTTTNNSSGGYGSVSAASDRIREGLSNSTGPGSEGLMPEQQFKDNANLRKKYDELVAFSVNLTAERDILNNALEQAKRDLNREMAARMSAEDSAVQAPSRSSTRSKSASDAEETKKAKSGFSFFQLLVIATVMFFVGRYVGAEGVIKAVTKGQDL